MRLTLTSARAERAKKVYLNKELPVDQRFGNTSPLPQGSEGFITSHGFQAGTVRVEFQDFRTGTVGMQFDRIGAEDYLTVDVP